MQRFIQLAFIFLFFFTAAGNLFAAVKKVPVKITKDTSEIIVKNFNKQALNKFKADKDFDYSGQATGEPSFWERLWNWLWNSIFGWFNKIPYGGSVFKYLLLGLAIGLLIYIIIKSAGLDPIQLLRGEAKKMNLAYSESLENIHEINFDTEIEKAVAQLNYRLAVRLLYLKCLKQLSDKNLIQWQIDKTNTTYFYELTNPDQKQTFGLLTKQFEYIWYGDFNIDKDAFGNINQLFQNFKKLLA